MNTDLSDYSDASLLASISVKSAVSVFNKVHPEFGVIEV